MVLILIFKNRDFCAQKSPALGGALYNEVKKLS